MLVDWEKVCLELEAIFASKKSHGQSDLLLAVAELKADYRIPEGMPEQALRQYGNEIGAAIHRGEAPRPAEAAPVATERPDGPDIEASSLGTSQRPKEDTCQTHPPRSRTLATTQA